MNIIAMFYYFYYNNSSIIPFIELITIKWSPYLNFSFNIFSILHQQNITISKNYYYFIYNLIINS